MKFSFRRTALVVSILMGAVFIYQLYWLNGLYRTTSGQMEKDIYEALEVADQSEIFLRLEKIKEDTTDTTNQDYNFNIEAGSDKVLDETHFEASRDSNSVSISSRTKNKKALEEYKSHAVTTQRLARYMQKGMHQAIDPFLPPSFTSLDSLLHDELLKRGIRNDYRVQLIATANDSVLASLGETVVDHHFKAYDFAYDMKEAHAYRLWLRNPNKQVIKQMSGILATSVIILALLIYIVIYLMQTIRKLQTEEELKTNFTNNMTHELKTPIAVSYAAVDALLIADKPASAERQKKYLNIAKEQMGYLSGLVEQILSMSRRDNQLIELKPEPVNLEEIISGLIEKLRLVSDKPIELETRLNPSTLVADQLHLSNILNNLMENGIKYSDNPAHLIISTQKEGNTIAISVEDHGIGIDAKYQKRLFDKFYRVPTGNRHNAKGFGLGLFYVKEMTEKQGGTVEVKSELGKGSVFTIKIPQ